ncbi:guanosine-3',5'-bis(diphosphate) 3'-pyrophosphohydrolase MESH1 isoform X2 [Lagopus muta]|uniref:guanosine-3',5'-bis(diphosphate) 3'-pyrophosphohydrolase MESH1 isoform X2 n=1 Tax=Lagopus muta TaxID=64668 RepID=UPI00209CE776|nr:guanosine-3',5'-bis(diphosphate) 3'-pyrophosphohydrolase MESH1 isoform X2 [Lagopus muta]
MRRGCWRRRTSRPGNTGSSGGRTPRAPRTSTTPSVPLRPGPRWGRRRPAGPDRPPALPNSPRPPQAALLHDTVEDTDTTLPEIEERFGPEVRRVVEELTDDKTLPKAERKRLQVERAAGSSARAKLVKLADKLHNLRDLQRCAPKGWSEERVQEYFRWAAEVVAGLRGTSPPLEAALQRLLEERGVAPGPGTGQ